MLDNSMPCAPSTCGVSGEKAHGRSAFFPLNEKHQIQLKHRTHPPTAVLQHEISNQMRRQASPASGNTFSSIPEAFSARTSRALLVVTAVIVVISLRRSLLGRLLLLLVLSLRLLSQWPSQDLENFLVRNLLVRLEFGQIWAGRRGQSLETVLRDGCNHR